MRALTTMMCGAILLVGCIGPNKRAVEYRNKGRERYAEGQLDLAMANYLKAKELDKDGKIAGLEDERVRVTTEKARVALLDAWSKYDRGEFQQAHAQLISIKDSKELSTPQVDAQVMRSLGDTAAMAWEEIEVLRKRHFYLRAQLFAEYLVKPLPPAHGLRVRAQALESAGIAFHLTRMHQLEKSFPASAAFHYLVARRLGADADPEGLELIAAVKRTVGDATAYLAAAKTGTEQAQEEQLVLARQVVGTWDPMAITLLGNRYGMNDVRLLDEVWNGTAKLEPYPKLAAIALPPPDDLPIAIDDPGTSQKYKALDFWYAIGSHALEKHAMSTGAGGALRFPSKTARATYELSGFFESESLGGDANGYGTEFVIAAVAKAPLVLGLGLGYRKDEIPNAVDPTMTATERSFHVPLIVRTPIAAGFAASLEARLNLLALTNDKQPLPMEQHYSPITARIYGPIPLLGDAVPALRALGLEAYATYTKDSPQELTYGGRLVYRSTLDGNSSGSGGTDLWDKVSGSTWATQTLLGPTWDFWLDLGTTPLARGERQHGMGTVFRVPNKDAGSVYEFNFHFASSGLGGNVGGWGMDYILMKPLKKLGVVGFGLGYLSNSISEGPANAPEGYKKPEQNSFHVPLVMRIPLGSAATVALEARLNFLALGGTGDPELNEKRHFHLIGTRLWLPLPFLGDLSSIFNKFHLEGHIGYVPGGDRTLNYGGMLVWRPIVTKRL